MKKSGGREGGREWCWDEGERGREREGQEGESHADCPRRGGGGAEVGEGVKGCGQKK